MDVEGGGSGLSTPARPPTFTFLPGLPPSLDRAWRAFVPSSPFIQDFINRRADFARRRSQRLNGGVCAPDYFKVPEEEYEQGLRCFQSPSSSWYHPPHCSCNRPTCPVLMGW